MPDVCLKDFKKSWNLIGKLLTLSHQTINNYNDEKAIVFSWHCVGSVIGSCSLLKR